MSEPDDRRMVTTTVARLKAFEQAVHDREWAGVTKSRASDALDAAKLAYDRAVAAENHAIDAQIAATQALHQAIEVKP